MKTAMTISMYFHCFFFFKTLIFVCVFNHTVYTEHSLLIFCGFFWPCCVACKISVPQTGIEPGPQAVKVWNPNPYSTRELPVPYFFYLP